MSNYRYFFIIFLALIAFNVQSKVIKEIEIIGLDNISRGTVLNYFPFEVGDNIEVNDLEKIKEKLLQTNFFADIKVSLFEEKILLNIKENPTIKYINFIGYKDDKVLNDEIISNLKKNYSLEIGKIFAVSELKKLLSQLSKLYQTQGFYKTTIEFKPIVDDKNRIGIELIFNEGERALIKSFDIKGLSFFPIDDLISLFEIGEPDFFLLNYFTKKDNFSSIELESGIQKIRTKYLNSGFLDFEIVDKNIKYDETSDGLNILLSFNEGKQFKVKKISLLNIDSIEESNHLRSLITIKNGEFFSRKKLISDINKLADFYQSNGYAFTDLDSKISKIPSTEFIEIIISINPNVRTYINRVNISGNNTTQDDVIRRELSLHDGQIYSKKEIEDSIKKIKRLGYFSSVNYDIRKLSKNADMVDLNIDVIETKTGEISIGLSHASSTGASVNAGISQNNILGTGNIFNAAISNSSAVKETSFYFKNPNINNYGHSISYGLFNKEIDASNLDASSYSINENGAILGYGFAFDNISKIFVESKFSSLDLTCGSELNTLYEVAQCASNQDFDAKVAISFESDSLNDYYFPSEGHLDSMTFTSSIPSLSDFDYYQIETSHRSYHPVLNDKTFKFSTRLNFASGYKGKDLPFFKRYFEGGSSSIRGFDFNSLGAKYPNGKPKGGELSLITSIGLASSLDFLGIDNPNMKGILFSDAGTISEKLSEFKLDDLRSSVGLQFAWITPIGPLGFNFAQPTIKKDGDSTKTFSFELGSKF